MEGSENLRNE